jgi:hypothetical protein
MEVGWFASGVEQRELGLSPGFTNSDVEPIVVDGVISIRISSSEIEVPS